MNSRPTDHPADPPHPPTDPRQNRKAFYIAAVGALIALVAVIAFNLRAPEGRLEPPCQATTGTPSQGPHQTGGPANAGRIQDDAPQASDTPTSAARDAMGAPAGAAPTPPSPASRTQ